MFDWQGTTLKKILRTCHNLIPGDKGSPVFPFIGAVNQCKKEIAPGMEKRMKRYAKETGFDR